MKWQQGLKDYQNYLRLERGLSENSIINYSLDIKKLMRWLETNEINTSPVSISEEILQDFIYDIAKRINPRLSTWVAFATDGWLSLPHYLTFK